MRVLPQGRGDAIQHTFEISQHLVVPEAEDAVALQTEERFASSIGFTSRRVMSTIELDDHPQLGAAEVDDVWSEWMLPAELCAFELTIP